MTNQSTRGRSVVDRLKAIVGDRAWREGADLQRYLQDPRGRFKGQARLVLLPESTEDVARIVRLCRETGTGLVPFGGGTGVVAGQLSLHDAEAIVLSVERLNKIRTVDRQDFTMVVEAGCILENVHSAAQDCGLQFPLSMASKGSCTIGGQSGDQRWWHSGLAAR